MLFRGFQASGSPRDAGGSIEATTRIETSVKVSYGGNLLKRFHLLAGKSVLIMQFHLSKTVATRRAASFIRALPR